MENLQRKQEIAQSYICHIKWFCERRKLSDRAQIKLWQDWLEISVCCKQTYEYEAAISYITRVCARVCVCESGATRKFTVDFLGLTKRTTKLSFSDKRQINV